MKENSRYGSVPLVLIALTVDAAALVADQKVKVAASVEKQPIVVNGSCLAAAECRGGSVCARTLDDLLV